MAVEAIFYGETFETPLQEFVTSSIVAVFCAIMPFFSKMVFKHHKVGIFQFEEFERERWWLRVFRIFCHLIFCTCFIYRCKGCKDQDTYWGKTLASIGEISQHSQQERKTTTPSVSDVGNTKFESANKSKIFVEMEEAQDSELESKSG